MRENHDPDTQENPRDLLGRRALLRRAGTIAAIAGGAAVVQAAGTGTAQAAAGGNVTMGSANVADATATSVTSSTTDGATLGLANTGTEHGPLALAPSADGIFSSNTAAVGELFVGGASGDLWYVNQDIAPSAALVFNEATANQVVGIQPVRMLDTRSTAGRANILDLSVLNSAGQLKAKTWLQLDLSPLALFFESAFINLTAVGPTIAGFLTVAPAPTAAGVQPSTSSLNYTAKVNIANSGVAPTSDGSVYIYSSSAIHVLLDVTALNLPSTSFLAPGVNPAIAQLNHANRRTAFAALRNARSAGR